MSAANFIAKLSNPLPLQISRHFAIATLKEISKRSPGQRPSIIPVIEIHILQLPYLALL